MAMTEAEATTKWCPFAQSRLVEWRKAPSEIHNEIMGDVPTVLCLGSGCMAWRWSRAKETKAYLDAVQAEMKASGTNFNIASNKVWTDTGSTFEQVEGYCGLAGKPE